MIPKKLKSCLVINNLYIKVDDDKQIDKTNSLLEKYIESKGISSDYYSISSQDSMINTMDNINNTLSLLLGGIASISLVVAGIGVMNVMLVSVTERTGIRAFAWTTTSSYPSLSSYEDDNGWFSGNYWSIGYGPISCLT